MTYSPEEFFIWTIGDSNIGSTTVPLVWSPGFFNSEEEMHNYNWGFVEWGLCIEDPKGDFIPFRSHSEKRFRIITYQTLTPPQDNTSEKWLTLLGNPT